VFQTYDFSDFGTIDETSNLYEIQADGTSLRQITATTATDAQRIGIPRWTPDGQSVVAGLGTVNPSTNTLIDVEPVFVDPTSGEWTPLDTPISGAAARLQPG
jgi:Tol biopolymer transport system component